MAGYLNGMYLFNYMIDIDKMKIPFELSKRKKLSNEERLEVKERYKRGYGSQSELARAYSVSKRTIQFCIHPERYETAKQQRRERYARGDYLGMYYNREEHTKAIADLRERKRHYLKTNNTISYDNVI